MINKFTKEFIEEFCYDNGEINWGKIARLNSEAVSKSRKKSKS